MRETINVPENDKFQVITEHPPEGLNVAGDYLGNTYSKDIVIIQITMNTGRTVEMKKAFFKRIADDIHAELKLRRDNVVINLVECVKENWSFGSRSRNTRLDVSSPTAASKSPCWPLPRAAASDCGRGCCRQVQPPSPMDRTFPACLAVAAATLVAFWAAPSLQIFPSSARRVRFGCEPQDRESPPASASPKQSSCARTLCSNEAAICTLHDLPFAPWQTCGVALALKSACGPEGDMRHSAAGDPYSFKIDFSSSEG